MAPPSTTRQPLSATDSNANIISLLNPESPEKLNPVSPVKSVKGEEISITPIPITLPGITITSLTKSTSKETSPVSLSDPFNTPTNKRKAEEINDDDPRLETIDLDCDQVRQKIRSFLASGEMKSMQFQKELGVSSPAYGRFMGNSGATNGSGSDTYVRAFQFFKRREILGIKPTVKKVRKSDDGGKYDVSEISLEGEETVAVPVFDSCDEIRSKIRKHLAEPGVSQAGFLREIAKTYRDGRRIQSKVLNDFLGKKGIGAGNTSAVFYSSYVYFEKLRIKEKEAKSKHRLDMERNYMDEGGFDVKHRMDGRSYC